MRHPAAVSGPTRGTGRAGAAGRGAIGNVPAMRRLGMVAGLALVLAGALAACGSSPSTTATTAGAPPASGSGSNTTASGGAALPAVGGATDLAHEPTLSPGSAPAPTGLETEDLVTGTGTRAVASDTVTVRYVGADYTTGKDFDSSWSRGQPTQFPLNEVVPGFSRGIVGMKVGGRREIVIPPALGYGASGSGPVGPNETLVFVVDLVSIP